jgi:hypothetical protein
MMIFLPRRRLNQNEPEKSLARLEICWNRSTAISGRIFESGKNDEVRGSLNICAPFVMIRGLSLCSEVVDACSESIINDRISQ